MFLRRYLALSFLENFNPSEWKFTINIRQVLVNKLGIMDNEHSMCSTRFGLG